MKNREKQRQNRRIKHLTTTIKSAIDSVNNLGEVQDKSKMYPKACK